MRMKRQVTMNGNMDQKTKTKKKMGMKDTKHQKAKLKNPIHNLTKRICQIRSAQFH
jgi:hypothetical protein